ncbi:uncharacterized protein [Dermacentor albipictus]|uniref:uncharacterized protein isoform X2 n=1 Tax=Dermacentor albipictus TaxID=60249 RepID=UPI0031FCE634
MEEAGVRGTVASHPARGRKADDGAPRPDHQRGSAGRASLPGSGTGWSPGSRRPRLSEIEVPHVAASPPRPPPVLVGEQVRNLPKRHAPSLVQRISDEDGHRHVRFDESLLMAPDAQYEFQCFMLVLATILTFVLGFVAYHYSKLDINQEYIPSTTTTPDITNASTSWSHLR